jgi:hypothetical protein
MTSGRSCNIHGIYLWLGFQGYRVKVKVRVGVKVKVKVKVTFLELQDYGVI